MISTYPRQHCVSQEGMSADASALIERYPFDYGQTYDSYLVTEPDREPRYSPVASAGTHSFLSDSTHSASQIWLNRP